METLKRERFWVGLGALLLVAAVIYGVAVAGGVNAEIRDKTKKLDDAVSALRRFASIPDDDVGNPEKGLPVREVADYWSRKRQALETEARAITEKYRARDRAFEQIPGIVRGEVELTRFVAELRGEVQRLQDEFKGLVEEGAAFDKSIPVAEPTPQKDEEIPFAQKKYLMARAVLRAAKEAGARRVVSMAFREAEKADPKAPPREVERLGVEADLRMQFPGVPKLVAEILSADVTFEVRKLSVETVPVSFPELDPWKVFEGVGASGPASGATPVMRSFPRDVFIGTSKPADPRTKGRPPELKEPPVKVVIALDALDFNLLADRK